MRPRLCFFENVEGHITLGLSNVIEDLARMGYRTTWGIFSAAEVGAPHSRKRVFILAVSNSFRGAAGFSGQESRKERVSGEPDYCCHEKWPSRLGEQQHQWEPSRITQRPLGGDLDGAANRMDYAQLCVSCDNRTDELRLLGNGVVPATAHKAFVTLLQELT
jgi:site-specific DNA-cytosine methylase